MEFDSETKYGRRDNEVVSIGRSAGSQKDNMCFFTIDSVNEDHSGDWTCTVYGGCQEGEFDDYEDEDDSFDGKKKRSIKDKKHILRLKRQTRNRTCKSDDCDEEKCENKDMQKLKIAHMQIFLLFKKGICMERSQECRSNSSLIYNSK